MNNGDSVGFPFPLLFINPVLVLAGVLLLLRGRTYLAAEHRAPWRAARSLAGGSLLLVLQVAKVAFMPLERNAVGYLSLEAVALALLAVVLVASFKVQREARLVGFVMPASSVENQEDPGWEPALRRLLKILFVYGLFSKNQAPRDSLVELRLTFLALPLGLVGFLVSFSFISEWNSGDEGWFPAALVAGGTILVLLVARIRSRPLDTSSAEGLATSFRTRMFTGVGLSETIALLALVFVVVANSLWLYFIGLGYSLVGLALVAPGPRYLDRQQALISAAGSPLSLVAALRMQHS